MLLTRYSLIHLPFFIFHFSFSIFAFAYAA